MKIKSYKNLCGGDEAMETFRMIISFADSVCVNTDSGKCIRKKCVRMMTDILIKTVPGLHITQFTFYV